MTGQAARGNTRPAESRVIFKMTRYDALAYARDAWPLVREMTLGDCQLTSDRRYMMVNSMPICNPPHPGGIVRRQCLEPLGLSVTEAAKALSVTRQALSDLVNERSGISVDMAIRLSKAFGSSPEAWLGMQTAYDLWQARGRFDKIRVRSFKAA